MKTMSKEMEVKVNTDNVFQCKKCGIFWASPYAKEKCPKCKSEQVKQIN